MDIRQQYRSMQGRFMGPWSLLSAPTFFFWRCKLHKVPDGKLLVAECRLSLFQCNSILNIGRHIKLINFDLNPIFIHLQGVLFYWSALKMTKCQTLRKFWHLELFWWDLLCNLTLRTFRGRPVKKTTLYMLYTYVPAMLPFLCQRFVFTHSCQSYDSGVAPTLESALA